MVGHPNKLHGPSRECLNSGFDLQFLLDESTGDLKALRPLGEAEFMVTPRELPTLMSFDVRLDSSLRNPGAATTVACVHRSNTVSTAVILFKRGHSVEYRSYAL